MGGSTVSDKDYHRTATAYHRVVTHIKDCPTCQEGGGEDAPKSELCLRAQALYVCWERAMNIQADRRG
jgi:hypothetical protein